jgi:outer membrane biosynthesis protein TonB
VNVSATKIPAAALWKVKQGTVVATIVVSSKGTLSEIKITGTPSAELNDEAITAIAYKFKPAIDPDGCAASSPKARAP